MTRITFHINKGLQIKERNLIKMMRNKNVSSGKKEKQKRFFIKNKKRIMSAVEEMPSMASPSAFGRENQAKI